MRQNDFFCRFYAAKVLDIILTEYPVPREKGVNTPFSLLPARTGLGSAQITGQGTSPL